MDMTDWGEGPWLDEPDELEFESCGFRCHLKRSPASGNWCGYVHIPKTHPLYECADYDDDKIRYLDVHGGVTFFEHVMKEASGEEFAIIGFDTAHSNDYSPVIDAFYAKYYAPELIESRKRVKKLCYAFERTYKTMPWVRMETERLAAQLKILEDSEQKLSFEAKLSFVETEEGKRQLVEILIKKFAIGKDGNVTPREPDE